MGKFWGRTYELVISTNAGEKLTYKPPLHIKFFVNNYYQHSAATARISIYGLSARARELIQVRNDKKNHYGLVELSGGYEDNKGRLFTGQINSVQVSKDGVNTVVTLYCASVSEDWRNATVFTSWGDNTPYIDVIRDIAKGFGNEVEILGDFSDLPVLPYGRSGGGKLCRELLDELKEAFRFEWMHHGMKTVIRRQGAARTWVTHNISALSGMEGVPRWYLDKLEVDVKMSYQIQPDDTVKITSDFWTMNFSDMYFSDAQGKSCKERNTGRFNVLHTRHEGGLWGDTWKTTVICQWREDTN